MRKLLVILMFITNQAFGEELYPDYTISQTAGYLGFVSGGVGYEIGSYNTALLVGYVPAMIGGEDLWSVSWKNDVRIYSIPLDEIIWTPLYVGTSLLLSLDKDTFVLLPDQYPDGYYPPTGLRFAPYIGTEARFNNHSLYVDLTSLDYYLEVKVRNPDFVKWSDICTLGIGYKYWFE